MSHTRSIAELQAEAERPTLRRALGPLHLTALGIGSVIGTGIFVLTGTAASQNAGPALVLAMIVAAVACALAGLCYAELASMIPVAGSAYTYAYASSGELMAWIIGWDLIL
jgi:basic amino acid/polyamine antiporter, APA family